MPAAARNSTTTNPTKWAPCCLQCGDGLDNDGDGRVDLADPGCQSEADPREASQPDDPAPICSNGLDDDGDGITDFPLDPGCSAAGDNDSEADDPGRLPPCGNGLDDDGDGYADYPEDPGCAGVGDGDEGDPAVLPACSDGRDNDRDGAIDYPADTGCTSAADGTELGSCGAVYDVVDLEPGREFQRQHQRAGRSRATAPAGAAGPPRWCSASGSTSRSRPWIHHHPPGNRSRNGALPAP
jgi:hypothetical protein